MHMHGNSDFKCRQWNSSLLLAVTTQTNPINIKMADDEWWCVLKLWIYIQVITHKQLGDQLRANLWEFLWVALKCRNIKMKVLC